LAKKLPFPSFYTFSEKLSFVAKASRFLNDSFLYSSISNLVKEKYYVMIRNCDFNIFLDAVFGNTLP